jgi:predicted metal-dependent hydrolase
MPGAGVLSDPKRGDEVSQKEEQIKAIVEKFRGREFNEHYLAYFECFNRQLYYEAHEVLEKIWLPKRSEPDGPFYKGLIQLAGAFVHLQKNRSGPAESLFRLAKDNLSKYPGIHHDLNLKDLLKRIDEWSGELRAEKNPLATKDRPALSLTIKTEP